MMKYDENMKIQREYGSTGKIQPDELIDNVE